MKWIQLLLITLTLFLPQRFMNLVSNLQKKTTSVNSEWLIRFENSQLLETCSLPREIRLLENHAPLHSIVIETSLSELQLREEIKKIKGVRRIEKGFRDISQSHIYPTGFALLEITGDEALVFLKEKFNLEPLQNLEALQWCVVDIPTTLSFDLFRDACLQSPYFRNVHRDEITNCTAHQANDPMYSISWHIQQISDKDLDAPEAWSLLPAGAPIRSVAIIEGVGFDTLNSDLAGRFIDTFNAVDNTTNVYSNTSPERHGTATCGIPGAIANNAISATGLGYNKLKIQAIRIGYNITSTGNFSTTSVMQAAAINRAIAQSNTAAISMSFGSSSYQSAFSNAINSARLQGRGGKGIPVFASTGNSGLSSWTTYPASYSGVIAVGATTINDARASFSNYGPGITLSAPGSSISTTDITGSEGYTSGDNTNFSGTSAASPVAAAVGALMIVVNDQITETQVKQLMAQACEKVGGFSYIANSANPYSTWSNELGYGRINMRDALQLSMNLNSATPDITLTATSVSSNAVQIGQTLSIYATQQIAPSNGSAVFPIVEYRYSNDAVWSSDDLIIGTDGSSLGAGIANENENITFTIPSGTGTKYVLIRADAQGAVSELNESNNTVSIAVTLPSTAALPDLIITSAALSASSVQAGQPVTISCNQAISSAGNTTLYPSVQYRLSSDAAWSTNDTFLGSDVSALSSSSAAEAENITFTSTTVAGSYFILIRADAGNTVAESNENNNVTAIPITITAQAVLPDIYVSNIAVSSATISPGNNVTVNCRQGITSPSPINYTVQLSFYWSVDAALSGNDLLLGSGSSVLSPLIPYELESISFQAPTVASGTYYILIVADATYLVAESNESNIYTQPIQLTNGISLADIGISNLAATASTAIEGSSINVSCLQYTTAPNANASDILLQYRWGSSPVYSPTMQLLGIDYSSLGAGDADDPEDQTFTIPAGTGQRYLFVVADASNVITESNENNNVAVWPMLISAAAPEWDNNQNEPLEIQRLSNFTPSVFPNPANETVFVHSNDFEWESVSFLNTSGNLVRRVNRIELSHTLSIPIYDLPAGMYVLQFHHGDTFQSCRLVVN